jgi:hypothetical protein
MKPVPHTLVPTVPRRYEFVNEVIQAFVEYVTGANTLRNNLAAYIKYFYVYNIY